MYSYLLALSFLTVLPVKFNNIATEKQMNNTLFFYPLVGVTLGIILAGVSWVGNHLELGLAGDVITVITLVLLTGALHLDGLMDTADGIMSGKSRDEQLEIMKDSRVGAMGVVACVSVIFLKAALLFSLAGFYKYCALILAPAAARWSFVVGIVLYPYARSKPGLGSVFGRNHKKALFVITTLFLLIVSYLLLKVMGVIVVICSLLFVLIINSGFKKILGGLTGDTYGAVGEMLETFVLFLVVVLTRVM